MDHHDVVEIEGFSRPVRDLESLEHPLEHALVATALLDGRGDSVALTIAVVDGEFAMVADDQVARVVLGFDQVDAQKSIDHKVVDLCDIAVVDQTEIVENDVVLRVP